MPTKRTAHLGLIVPVATALLLAGGPSRAGAENEIAVRLSHTFGSTNELAPLSDNNVLAQAELSYGRAIGWVGRGQFWLEGSYLFGRRSATLFDAIASDAWFHQIVAGVRYDLPIWRWLQLHARVGLGLGVATLDLGPSAGNSASFQPASDLAFAVAGHVLAGLALLWPRPWIRYAGGGGLTAGLVVEGGATYGSDFDFALAPETDDKRVHLPLTGGRLGGINPSGGVVRVGAIVRF